MEELLVIELPDAELYVERVGPKEAPFLYYLHGGPGYNSHSFRELFGDELTAWQVLYADQRGGGRSYGQGSSDLQVLAEDVRVTLDAVEAPTVTLLAHGFGALVAARVALDHPERVKGLVLVNPWISMPQLAVTLNERAVQLSTGSKERPQESATDEPAGDPAQLVDEAFALVNPKVLFDDLLFPNPAARLRLEHSDSEALLGPAVEDEPHGVWELDLRSELGSLTQPVVIIAGQLDGTSYPVQTEAVLERLPHSLVSLIDAGHYPWLDDPDTFTPVVLEALAVVTNP